MSTIRRRCRAFLDTSSFNAPTDKLTKSSIKLWMNADMQFEFGVGFGSRLDPDTSNWAAITVEVKKPAAGDKAPPATDAPRMARTIAVFDATVNQATWDDDSKSQVIVPFSAVETSAGVDDASGVGVGKWWLLVALLTTDGKTVPLAAGLIEFVAFGYNSGGTAPVLAETSYTKDEADALFAPIGEGFELVASAAAVTGPRKYFLDGDYLHLWNPVTSAACKVQLITA